MVEVINEYFFIILFTSLFVLIGLNWYRGASDPIWLKVCERYEAKAYKETSEIPGWIYCLSSLNRGRTFRNTTMFYSPQENGLLIKSALLNLFMKPVFIPWEEMTYVGSYKKIFNPNFVRVRLNKINIDICVPKKAIILDKLNYIKSENET